MCGIARAQAHEHVNRQARESTQAGGRTANRLQVAPKNSVKQWNEKWTIKGFFEVE